MSIDLNPMPHADLSSSIPPAAGEVDGPYCSSLRRTPSVRLYSRADAVVRVAPDDPGVCIVTDFAREEPWTITPNRSIGDALLEMVCGGTCALLVVQDDVVIGLITSCDIEGPRPLQVLRALRCRARREIKVHDMMTPWDQLATLEWKAVCAARAGQIEHYFRNNRDSHVMVVQEMGHRGPQVRGLISRTARLLYSFVV